MAITYPLIAVSTRLAIQRNDKSRNAYRGFTDAFRKILKKEGPKGFYAYVLNESVPP
jgi:adenine nucleotide transporter 17